MPSDLCAPCDHPENSHVPDVNTSKTVCQRCLIEITRKAAPHHEFVPRDDRMRTYLEYNARVSALRVGQSFTIATGESFTVENPCDNMDNGWWICTSHLLRFHDNQGKDFHCFIGNASHALVWYCAVHDRVEYAGV